MTSTIRRLVPLAALGVLAFSAAPLAAAVATLDGWTNVHSSPPGNATGSVTTSAFTASAGSQRILLVSAILEVGTGNTTLTTFSATLGGTAMTPVATTATTSAREHAGLWYVLESQVPVGSTTAVVSYATAANNVTGIHVKWASYRGVDQATPLAGSSATATGATIVTFGVIVNYLAGGETVYVTGNGGSPATMTAPTGFAEVIGATITTDGHTSFAAETAVHAAAGSYPANTQVTFGGTTSARSAIAVASLRPAVTTTVGNGTDPGATSLCPGGSATMLDAFTLQTSAGTDTVTAATVALATGTAAGLSLVEITNDAGTTVYGSVGNPATDSPAIPLTTSITATTTSTQYKVRITPRTHAAMPTPPGATYAVTGAVTAITSANAKAYNDTASATVTIDNASPVDPAWGGVTPQSGQVVLNWTNPVVADFNQVVILRNTVAITDAPAEGATYAQGAVVGTSTVRYVGSLQTFTDTGLTNGTAYYYRIFASDNCGNYSPGAATGPHTPTAPVLPVTPGAPSASAGSCSQVTVSVPYTGDTNGNSTTGFSRGPSATGPWTAVCANITGPSPRTCLDGSVSSSTTYYYQVTFADADGVSGTNPQVTPAVTTPVCSVDNTTVGTVTTTVASCNSVQVTATSTGDANQNGTATFQYGAGAAPGAWTGACTVSGPSPRQCSVSGLAASTLYSFRALFADADGVVGTNPTAGVQATTTACGADTVAPTITVLVPSRNAILSGADTVKVQVWDAGALAAPNPVVGQVDGTGSAGFTLVFAANASYACGAGCSVYQYALPAQTAGAHYVAVRATDAAGNVSVVTIPFRAAAAAAGSGAILRRTHGSQLCLDCHNLETHNSQYTSTKYGNWSIDCQTCHTPHSTTNIYLVRNAIETPASGVKAVDFRNTTGVGTYSYATPQASGSGVNVCEVCHTRTKNSDATPRARNNAATDWTKHYTGRCTGCHPHGKGFGAGESEGGASCVGCHKSIWDRMQATGGSTYKHTLAVDTVTDDAVAWGNPLGGNAAAARSCVNTCHNDHLHTATDDPNPTLHYNLAYADATSQASRAATTRTVATKAKVDFDNTLANGGLCISCHRNPVESGATPAHPAIVQASYAASAHNATSTTPGGAWQLTLHDGSNFTRNCTKCHWDANDGTTPAVAGTTAVGAVHGNANPSLLMGTTNPSSAPASFVCYRCHGGGATGADYSSKAVYQDGVKTYKHPMDADTAHASVTELNGAAWGNTLGVTGRHSNCQDCHDPHEAQKSVKQGTISASTTTTITDSTMNGRWAAAQWVGSRIYIPSLAAGQNTRAITASTAAGVLTAAAWTAAPTVGAAYYILDNKADGALQGAWGALLSSNPALWTAPASTNFTKATIAAGSGLQATLCFKCHSSFYWGAGTPPNGLSPNGTVATPVETDVAMEFNPNNRSGHPVLASLNNFTGSAAPRPLAAAQMVAPWNVAVGTQTMSCNDCHNTDAASPAAQGPHGSAVTFMIKNGAAKPGWPTAAASAAGFATTFCSDCHANANVHGRDGAHQTSCYRCHIVIPHGGKMSRLIGDNNGTMPARYSYSNNLANMYIQSFTKAATDAGYQQSNCQSGTSGCTNHNTAGSENW